MRIEHIWIVTKPDVDSTFEDICFDCDARGLMLQFKGGLSSDEILGMYSDKTEATLFANYLLNNR